MAFWVLGAGAGDTLATRQDFGFHGRRRPAESSPFDDDGRYDVPKRLRMAVGESVAVTNLAFLVIHQCETQSLAPSPSSLASSPCPSPSPSPSPCPSPRLSPVPCASPMPPSSPMPCATVMERTALGHSISMPPSPFADPDGHALDDGHEADPGHLTSAQVADLEAARLVHTHLSSFRRRLPDSQAERILRALVTPRSRGADFPLDNDALRSIFSAANELFFAGRLAHRVTWDWSHPACGHYESHIVGTTALRRSARLGGWETLIVLSSPILRDNKYNRRLLISTFLHEMIHSFMFIMCGLQARRCGGHTHGFRQIAALIDDWAGKECLRLTDMQAHLELFRGHQDATSSVHVVAQPPLLSDSMRTQSDDCVIRPNWRHADGPDDVLAHSDRLDAAHGPWQWCERENFGARHDSRATDWPYAY